MLSLAWMGFQLLLLLPSRFLRRTKKPGRTIILYGHKLHGNLNAIYEYSLKNPSPYQNLNIFFLTMDPHYFGEIKKKDNILFALNPVDLMKVVRADCIISDHGLHVLQLLFKFTKIIFIDVWHGIPFKGFTPHDFKLQHQYDETWVSSTLLKRLYVERFGFKEDRVQATGYGRTDLILSYHANRSQIRARLNIPSDKKVILFAPTWKQDTTNRNEVPFELPQDQFFHSLEDFALRNNAFFIIRYHLNTLLDGSIDSRHMLHLPLQKYPNGEEVVAISDVLITDWSSIAFDMMVLEKPIVFLDVPPPFKNGLSLPAEYRVGDLVKGLPELLASLTESCLWEDKYMKKYNKEYQRVKKLVYNDTIDGKSTSRYFTRLQKLLTN